MYGFSSPRFFKGVTIVLSFILILSRIFSETFQTCTLCIPLNTSVKKKTLFYITTAKLQKQGT